MTALAFIFGVLTALHGHRGGRRVAAGAGNHSLWRHAGRLLHRDLHHPRHVLREPALSQRGPPRRRSPSTGGAPSGAITVSRARRPPPTSWTRMASLLRQSPHRGHRDLHPHGPAGAGGDGPAPHLALPEHRAARDPRAGAPTSARTRSTIEESVATPIEAQMTGVDNMLYMYSTSTTSGGRMNLRVVFDVTTDPSIDEVLAQMRYSQASAQLPIPGDRAGGDRQEVDRQPARHLRPLLARKGPTIRSSSATTPTSTSTIPMTRVPGVGQVQISGAGQYAMRFWVRPDTLGKLERHRQRRDQRDRGAEHRERGGTDRSESGAARPAIHVHGPRSRPSRDAAAFEDIVVRARPDGSVVRLRDAARVELGAQTYNVEGRLNGRPGHGHRRVPAAGIECHRHRASRPRPSWRR